MGGIILAFPPKFPLTIEERYGIVLLANQSKLKNKTKEKLK